MKYDMRCPDCAYEFEAEASIQEGPPKRCPSCKKRKCEQKWDKAPAFHARLSPMHPRANRGRGY